jgi:hypothetical protein
MTQRSIGRHFYGCQNIIKMDSEEIKVCLCVLYLTVAVPKSNLRSVKQGYPTELFRLVIILQLELLDFWT